MKEKKKNNEGASPQKSLEKILQTEIEIAEKISAAREQANKSIETAKGEVSSLKTSIIEQARKDREEMLAKGVEIAKENARQRIEQARKESGEFEKYGENYIEEAVQQIEAIILGEFKGGDK